MGIKLKLFKELVLFSKKRFGSRDCFVCVCGSYVSNDSTKDSDLDLLFAFKKYDTADFKKIRDFVVDLHIRNNLKIDEEVPYETKLVVSYKDIRDAVGLKAFVKKGSKYLIHPITYDKEFLASRELRLRIILNALTTPNIYIYGNKEKYVTFRKKAEKAILRLARGLTNKTNLTHKEIFDILMIGAQGEEEQAHLGYKKERIKVVKYLKEIISRNSIS